MRESGLNTDLQTGLQRCLSPGEVLAIAGRTAYFGCFATTNAWGEIGVATDFDLQTLVRLVSRSQFESSRVMDAVTAVLREVAAENGLQPTDEQLRQVAQSLSPKLAQTAWPDSTSTSFEIPVRMTDTLP